MWKLILTYYLNFNLKIQLNFTWNLSQILDLTQILKYDLGPN